MDSMRAERLGAQPLAPFLKRIADVHTRRDLLALIANLHVSYISPMYDLYVGQDEKASERMIVHLSQGGLGMPDRDYYFGKDANTVRVRNAYVRHVAAMFRLLGEDSVTAKASAATVMRLETAFARRSRTLEQRRDPWANYHKMSLVELNRLTPTID